MQTNKQAGFTIIELTLAMAFLAFVMIFSATVIMQMTNTYMKGLTVKQINQAGRSISDDLSRSLQSAVAEEVNTSLVEGGLLCVGSSAYVWNPIYLGGNFNVDGIDAHKLAGEPISLARVSSDSIDNCQNPSEQYDIGGSTDNVSLLGGRARVIHSSAKRSALDPKLVNIKLVIGTFDRSEIGYLKDKDYNNVTNSTYIKPDISPEAAAQFTCRPDRYGNFCAFAEFSATVYVTR